MNHLQFLIFAVYVASVLSAGAWFRTFLSDPKAKNSNRALALGEALLLGQIFMVGVLLVLSLVGLFKPAFLWGAAAANFLFLFSASARQAIGQCWTGWRPALPSLLFIALLLLFVFRNCYFLVDVDSVSTYLAAQRLWLEAGTSLIGDPTFDIRLFNPQYDSIAYSLGLSLFGQETLFPQLISVLWRVTCLLLVYGYTTYRFNGFYGLAAALFVALNDHFFHAGANQWVTLNAAVTALVFASAYHFWEAKSKNSRQHLVFAIVSLSQLPGCKFYAAYIALALLIFGIVIQGSDAMGKLREAFRLRRNVLILLGAAVLSLLWYLKNMIVTGDPLFPYFAARFQFFGWEPEPLATLVKAMGGLSVAKIFKYVSFLFIWPGVNPAKIVLIGLLLLPFITGFVLSRRNDCRQAMIELCYWLGICLLAVGALCLGTWQDPRVYRFLLCLFAFTAVFLVHFLVTVAWARAHVIGACLAVLLSMQGFKTVFEQGGPYRFPTVQENWAVLQDRLHMDDMVAKHYPEFLKFRKVIDENKDKLGASAWFISENNGAFFLPHRPRISLYFSTTILWSAYDSPEKVRAQLSAKGIQWVMVVKEGSDKLDFVPAEDFAAQAAAFDRTRERTFYDYGFPDELTRIR